MAGTQLARSWCADNTPTHPLHLHPHHTQLHEFPVDHTCPNLDNSRPLQLLPVNGSTPTWSPSPKDLSTNTNSLVNLSLVSVAKDWSTTVVDTFPVPFRVVHDASCNAQPTLTLGLNTNVGRLTAEELVVAGTAIGGPSTPTCAGRRFRTPQLSHTCGLRARRWLARCAGGYRLSRSSDQASAREASFRTTRSWTGSFTLPAGSILLRLPSARRSSLCRAGTAHLIMSRRPYGHCSQRRCQCSISTPLELRLSRTPTL